MPEDTSSWKEQYQAHMTNEGVDPFGAMGLEQSAEATGEVEESENPPSESEAPPDSPGQAGGEGQESIEASEEGQGEDISETLKSLGFKSVDDLIKSYQEIRAVETRNNQRLAAIEAQLAQRELAPPKQEERELTPEELEDLRLRDPEAALLYRLSKNPDLTRKLLGSLPEFSHLMNLGSRFEAMLMLQNLNQKHKDFNQYEQPIMEELKAMPESDVQALMSLSEGRGLSLMYELVALRKFREDTLKGKQIVDKANANVANQNKGKQNLGKGDLNAVAANKANGANPRGLDDFSMQFVIDPLGMGYRRGLTK